MLAHNWLVRCPRRRYRGTIASIGVAAVLAWRCTVSAASYDITADWSDAANPNGVWTYREGTNVLPHVASWESGGGQFTGAQPGWARSENGLDRIPFWFMSVAAPTFVHDWQAGDVVVHTTDDANGIGNGAANVIWTSPDAGLVTVAGGVWMGREISRSNHWALYRNAVLLTEGDIASGDAFSRTMPFALDAGSGGSSAVTDVPILVGDVIRLTLTRMSMFGDFVGVDLRLTTVSTTTTSTTSSTTTTSTSTTSSTTTSTSTPSTTTIPPATTTTTLPATGCGGLGAEPTFVSIGCRLSALLARVEAESGLGTFQPKLASRLEKAAERTVDAGTLCREPTLKKARKRLQQAAKAMTQYVRRLGSPAARRRLDPALREALRAEGDPIREDLKTLRGAVRCPDDAPPT